MSATTAKSLSTLDSDMALLGIRPTVYVIDGMQIRAAYVARHPESIHADMEVVYHGTHTALVDLPFQPIRSRVNAWDVKEDESSAKKELLSRCWRLAAKLTRELTGAEL